MVYIRVLSSVILLSWFTSSVFGQADVDRLSYLYVNSFENSDSLKYRKEFFEVFPSTFLEFCKVYNNPKSSLYSKNSDHFELFSSLEVVDDTTYLNKLIDLSIGGYWDADAVFMLQLLVIKRVFENPKLLGYLLKKRTPAEVRSFSYFLFDGINITYKNMPKPLGVLQNEYEFIYVLMKSSLENVVYDRTYINNTE